MTHLPARVLVRREEKLALLEKGECPAQLGETCTFHWKRQELSLVLDLDHLAWALDKAEADLRRKSGLPTESMV